MSIAVILLILVAIAAGVLLATARSTRSRSAERRTDSDATHRPHGAALAGEMTELKERSEEVRRRVRE